MRVTQRETERAIMMVGPTAVARAEARTLLHDGGVSPAL